MNKKIQIILSVIIIIILFGIQVSYALPINEGVAFFEVSTNEITLGETLEMTFNLDKIEYDNFKIILNSNIDTGEIYTEENVKIEENSDAIVIEVDKNKLSLGKIKLCYSVTEDMGINTIIQLKAQVKIEEEVETQDDGGNTVVQKQEKVVLEESQNVTIAQENIEKDNIQKNNDNEQKDNTQKNIDNEQKDDTQKEQNTETKLKPSNSNENTSQNSSQNLSNTKAKSGNTNVGSSSASGKQSSLQSGGKNETATYNGSNNNYLKKLKVKGLDLNTTFNKENTTYFVNVNGTSSIKITAIAEDDSAKVTVAGNDSISEGTNKILIIVTAENGDVRYYRIFVNCELS